MRPAPHQCPRCKHKPAAFFCRRPKGVRRFFSSHRVLPFVATLWETRGKKRQNPLGLNASSRKKVLSLVLCVAVMLSVMVMGAGAAFSDQDKIENTEAVGACSALNIIGGYEDGSFHPERNIKRSEITKMICVALNGGTEPNVSTNAVPTFSDVRGTSAEWAEGYIEACVAQGIVSGVGGGRFAPDGNVTAAQLAKMLLVCLGYNSDNEGFTGTAWETNVNVRASQKGLYVGLESLDTSAAVTRDQAAQMVWNALQAYEVEYKTTLVTDENGQLISQVTVQDKVVQSTNDKLTLLRDKYNANIYEGVLTTSGEYSLTADGAKDRVGINDVKKIDGQTPDSATVFTAVAEDMDLTDMVGQYVKVLYNNKTEEVYGVYGMDTKNKVIVETTADKVKIDSNKLVLDGEKYDFNDRAVMQDGTAKANVNGYFGADYLSTGDKVIAISNDGDSKIDLVLVETIAVAKVNYVGTESFSITKQAGTRTSGSGTESLDTFTNLNQDLEDVVIVGDAFAKDDFVLVTEDYYTGTDAFEVITPVTATITGYNKDKFLIDGTWYVDEANILGTSALANGLTSGDTIDMIAYGDVCYYAKKTAGSNAVETIAFVYSAGETSGDGVTGGTYQAKLIFADGTKITVDTVNDEGDSTDYSSLVGHLVTWESNSSGEYILEDMVDGTNEAGYDSVQGSGTQVKGNSTNQVEPASGKTTIGKILGYDLADDAVVFVMKYAGANMNTGNTGNDAKVITGKEAKSLIAADYNTTTHALVSKSNGFDYAMVATLAYKAANQTLPNEFDGKTYGYLVEDAYRSYNSDESAWYRNYKIWTGTSTITVSEKSNASVDAMTQGNVITFDQVDETTVKNVKRAITTTTQVTGYDEAADKLGLVGETVTELASDATVLYVDSQTYRGYETGFIREADDTDASGTITSADQANVRYLLNSTGDKIAFVLVDVNNKMKNPAGLYTPGDFADTADLNARLAAGEDVTINGSYAVATTALDVAEDSTLTVIGTLTLGVGGANIDGTVVADALAMGSQNLVIDNGGSLTVKGAVTQSGSETITVTDGSLEITGATAVTTLTLTAGTVKAAAVTGNVVVNGGTLTAGAITGDLTLANDGKATVTSVSGTLTGAATTELTITGAITGTKTLPAGKVILKAQPTAALTFNAASDVTFETTIDIGTVIPTANAGVTGAKITFKVAPTNLAVTANNSNGFFVNTGTTVLTNVSDIELNVVYENTANAGGGSNNGWVKTGA